MTDRDRYLRRVYGITEDEFEALVADAGNRCPVCLKPFTKTPVVDHDHKTGVVRGVLCVACNYRVIGRHRDHAVFGRASEYLRRPPATRVLGGERTVPKKSRPVSRQRASSRGTVSRTKEAL